MSLEQFGKDYQERVEKAVAAIKQGKGILLVDDADRENEGDIIFAAEKMTVKDMALMIRECSGIVCLCLTPEMAEALALPLMVKDNTSKYGTAFTITIEAKEGVTTGVSAADRITTIQAAVKDGAKPEDLSHPGHVFPLIAKAGGVLERGGHTEGSVDLARLAGCKPAGVLCELTNEDGTMAKMPEITAFAKKHGMTVVSIEDICEYRKNKC